MKNFKQTENPVIHTLSENTLLLIFHTVRYLKAKQILGRTSYLSKRYLQKLGYRLVKKPFIPIQWRPLKKKTPFLHYNLFNNEDIIKNRFKFLNDPVEFVENIDWRVPEKSRLWRYNLHYFDYLRTGEGLPTDKGVALIKDWIDKNPPGEADAWDPFPISLRSVNWVKFLSQSGLPAEEASPIANSLYEQILWLEKKLEYHLLANHFFKNIKALIFASLFFMGEDSERWLNKFIPIIENELSEQILPDGGHYERSPMYHSMIFEDCLDLLNVCSQYDDARLQILTERLHTAVVHMAGYLAGMVHPDGRIALFNDSAFGIEAEPAALIDYFRRVASDEFQRPEGITYSFPDSGYYVLSPEKGAKLIIDCGPIGPDYQPGHSHCDTLSFELSLKGRRIIVDSGCYGYENDSLRNYNRSNRGHNTVTLDSENQSEIWASHRCAKRAYPIYARLNHEPGGKIIFEGAHDGYKRLSGRPIHHRRVEWMGGTISICDRIEGKGRHDIELRLHIHPEIKVKPMGEVVEIRDDEGIIASITSKAGRIEEGKGWYCPEFGLKEECTVLNVNHRKVSLPFETGWRINIGR